MVTNDATDSSAFAPGPGIDGATRSAPQAVARRAFLSASSHGSEVYALGREVLLSGLEKARSSEVGLDTGEVAAAFGDLALSGADGDLAAYYSQLWMAGVVALNDSDVRDFVRGEYAKYDAGYAQLLAGLLEISDREPVEGVSVERLASVMLTAVHGAVFRLRFVPELGGAYVSDLALGLWAGLTRPRGHVDDVLGRRIAGPLKGSLSDDEQESVAAAVRRLNNRAGWGAVSLSKVAQLSGVPVARLASVYPDHDHLSAVVWSDLAAGLKRTAGATVPDRVTGLERVVADLAEVACSHRELTASLLVARLSDRAGTGDGDGPGRVIVTLEDIIGGALSAAGTRGAPTASTIVDAVLLRAARTEVGAEDLVADVLGGSHRSGQ